MFLLLLLPNNEWLKGASAEEWNFLFTVIFHHSYRINFSFENKLEVIILEYWSEDSRFSSFFLLHVVMFLNIKCAVIILIISSS